MRRWAWAVAVAVLAAIGTLAYVRLTTAPSPASIRELLDAGEHELALAQSLKLLDALPGDPEALYLAGQATRLSGNSRDALGFYAQAAESRTSTGGDAQMAAADLLLSQGRIAAAERRLKAMVRDIPSDLRPHLVLADLYSAQGRDWEARLHHEHVLRAGQITLGSLLRLANWTTPGPASDVMEKSPPGPARGAVSLDSRRADRLGFTSARGGARGFTTDRIGRALADRGPGSYGRGAHRSGRRTGIFGLACGAKARS